MSGDSSKATTRSTSPKRLASTRVPGRRAAMPESPVTTGRSAISPPTSGGRMSPVESTSSSRPAFTSTNGRRSRTETRTAAGKSVTDALSIRGLRVRERTISPGRTSKRLSPERTGIEGRTSSGER